MILPCRVSVNSTALLRLLISVLVVLRTFCPPDTYEAGSSVYFVMNSSMLLGMKRPSNVVQNGSGYLPLAARPGRGNRQGFRQLQQITFYAETGRDEPA